jgi:uncharacterized protein DUF6544
MPRLGPMGNPRRQFLGEVMRARLPSGPGPADPVTDADLIPLPDAAQRYLRFMRVVGRPRDWAFQLEFAGRFRRRPGEGWMACETWQYNNRLAVARIFHIRIRLAGLIPVVARDTYLEGQGRMLIRLLDLFTIEDATGPEYDIGELVTYLNDAVLVAPSMLLVPEVTWAAVGADSFDVALSDHGRTVTARVVVDERGAPSHFSTADRFCAEPGNPKRLTRARWTTPVTGWAMTDDRQLPVSAQAIWQLPQGPFTYADFRPVPGTLVFNRAPGT